MSVEVLTLPLPEGVTAEEARLLLALKLFDEGRVSLGYAAAMVGQSKRAFIETCNAHGVSVIQTTPEDIRRDFETLQQRHGNAASERSA